MGVGKTSLVHTACAKFSGIVNLAAAIGCEKHSTANGLLNDILRRVIHGGKVQLEDNKFKAGVRAFGLSVEGQLSGFREQIQIDSINHASDFLGTILPVIGGDRREWIIIIDEFDRLKNSQTIDFFTELSKQMSVDKIPVKFVFCGVASNLNDLIGSHYAVDRYIKSVDLEPLLYGHIIDIVRYISGNFGVKFSSGQEYRISQIACGYPHFAHLIAGEVLRV